jgi:hypothetical protein
MNNTLYWPVDSPGENFLRNPWQENALKITAVINRPVGFWQNTGY